MAANPAYSPSCLLLFITLLHKGLTKMHPSSGSASQPPQDSSKDWWTTMRRYRPRVTLMRSLVTSPICRSQKNNMTLDVISANSRIARATQTISHAQTSQQLLRSFCELYTFPSSLFEDIITLQKESTTLVDSIIPRSKEKLVLNFITGDLINLYKLHKFDLLVEAFQMIKSWNNIPKVLKSNANYVNLEKYIQNGIEEGEHLQVLIYKFLISYTLAIGENLLSASLILDNSLHVDFEEDATVKQVLMLLTSVELVNNNDINHFTCIRILQQYPELKLTNDEANFIFGNFLHSASKSRRYPSFANKLYDILLKRGNGGTFSLLPSLVFTLIQWNLEFGNVDRACRMFQEVKGNLNHDNVENIETKAILHLLHSLNGYETLSPYLDEVITDLREQLYNLPDIESTLISIFGKSTNKEYSSTKFDSLIANIRTPTSRDTLRLLFETFAARGDVTNTEKILATLFEHGNKRLTALEFDIIIEKLLAENHYEQALEMTLRQTRHHNSQFAYITLVKFALSKRNCTDWDDFKPYYKQIMDASVVTFSRIANSKMDEAKSEVFGKLSMVIFDHVLETYGAAGARTLYTHIEQGKGVDFEEFYKFFQNKLRLGVRDNQIMQALPRDDLLEFSRFLFFEESQRIPAILKIIGLTLKKANFSLTGWCIEEMCGCGLTPNEATDLIKFVYGKEALDGFQHHEQ